MKESELNLNHGIRTTEQAANRFKNLRRRVRAMQRTGQPVDVNILVELCELDTSLAQRTGWVSNFIPSKNTSPI